MTHQPMCFEVRAAGVQHQISEFNANDRFAKLFAISEFLSNWWKVIEEIGDLGYSELGSSNHRKTQSTTYQKYILHLS